MAQFDDKKRNTGEKAEDFIRDNILYHGSCERYSVLKSQKQGDINDNKAISFSPFMRIASMFTVPINELKKDKYRRACILLKDWFEDNPNVDMYSPIKEVHIYHNIKELKKIEKTYTGYIHLVHADQVLKNSSANPKWNGKEEILFRGDQITPFKIIEVRTKLIAEYNPKKAGVDHDAILKEESVGKEDFSVIEAECNKRFGKSKATEELEDFSLESIGKEVEANIKDNKVYHASPKDLPILSGKETRPWSGEKGNVFVSPLKGLVACFVIDKDDVLRRVEEQLGKQVRQVNFGYNVWNKPTGELYSIPSEVIILLNIRGIKPITGVSSGYIYTIDYSKYKDKTHMFNKNKESDVEFLIEGDVTYLKKEKIDVKWRCVSSEDEIKRKGEAILEDFNGDTETTAREDFFDDLINPYSREEEPKPKRSEEPSYGVYDFEDYLGCPDEIDRLKTDWLNILKSKGFKKECLLKHADWDTLPITDLISWYNNIAKYTANHEYSKKIESKQKLLELRRVLLPKGNYLDGKDVIKSGFDNTSKVNQLCDAYKKAYKFFAATCCGENLYEYSDEERDQIDDWGGNPFSEITVDHKFRYDGLGYFRTIVIENKKLLKPNKSSVAKEDFYFEPEAIGYEKYSEEPIIANTINSMRKLLPTSVGFFDFFNNDPKGYLDGYVYIFSEGPLHDGKINPNLTDKFLSISPLLTVADAAAAAAISYICNKYNDVPSFICFPDLDEAAKESGSPDKLAKKYTLLSNIRYPKGISSKLKGYLYKINGHEIKGNYDDYTLGKNTTGMYIYNSSKPIRYESAEKVDVSWNIVYSDMFSSQFNPIALEYYNDSLLYTQCLSELTCGCNDFTRWVQQLNLAQEYSTSADAGVKMLCGQLATENILNDIVHNIFSKIADFIKWFWNKLKQLWNFFFGKRERSLRKFRSMKSKIMSTLSSGTAIREGEFKASKAPSNMWNFDAFDVTLQDAYYPDKLSPVIASLIDAWKKDAVQSVDMIKFVALSEPTAFSQSPYHIFVYMGYRQGTAKHIGEASPKMFFCSSTYWDGGWCTDTVSAIMQTLDRALEVGMEVSKKFASENIDMSAVLKVSKYADRVDLNQSEATDLANNVAAASNTITKLVSMYDASLDFLCSEGIILANDFLKYT